MIGRSSNLTCVKCGRLVAPAAGFCPNCGTQLGDPAFAPPASDLGTMLGTSADAATNLGPANTLPATEALTISHTGLVTSLDSPSPLPRVPKGDGPFQVGQHVGPRYTIIRLVGVGGMGAVYQAFDHELGVVVAIKVIRPEVMADPFAAADLERRFKQELLLARQVTHKNVVRIHELGEFEGIKFLTMPFIEGDELASLIQRQPHLPLERVLKIARGIATGLEAAHAAGVVHRDLKPANVMVDKSGEALIMDFGIARSTGGANPASPVAGSSQPAAWNGTETRAGSVVGTVQYMAPEQARAEPVDHRADIYAFGLILYDMLLHQPRARHAGTALDELTSRMQAAPPAPRSIDHTIPEPVDRLVTRCLQPDAAQRFQTTPELVAALNRLDDRGYLLPVLRRVSRQFVAGVVGGVLVLLGATWWLARGPAVPVAHEPVSVLITDFDNRSGDPVFEGAVEQTLAIALEGASYITVFKTRDARSIAAQLAPGKGDRITEEVGQLIARREGLKILLAGAIDKRPTGYRLEVRASDAATGKPIATAAQDVTDKKQVLNTVASMATQVRQALGESKTEMAKLAAAETVTAGSLDAMRAYANAQELLAASKFQEALQEYQRATELDPRFGRAYAGMAGVYANYFKQPDKAEASYQAALKHLDRMTEREKYRTLGTYYLDIARNYEKAIENFETLVKLYPADDGGHGNLALAYLLIGNNVPGAVAEVRKSLEIYPKNSLQRYNYAMYSMYAGDLATAITEGSRLVKENPSFEYNYIPIALSRLAQGEVAGGRDTYAQLAQVSPLGSSFASLGRADVEMYLGRHRDAVTLLRDGIAADRQSANSAAVAQKSVALAEAYLVLGDRGRAVQAANEAIKLSRHESTLFPAARVLGHAGQEEKAAQVAQELEKRLQRHTTAYARLISGEIAVQRGRIGDAIDAFRDAQKRHDSWFGRFLLGKTYAEAGHFAEALAELDLCMKRRGEAADVFFYDMPTLHYLPPAYYWLGRAQEGLGSMAEARKSYEQFLTLRADANPPDPLAADARQRVSAR